MAKRKKIKTPALNKSKDLKAITPPDYNNMPIIFSLEKLAEDKYCFSKLDTENKKQFAESIFKRRHLTWNQIQQTGRHALGTEKMPRTQIKGTIPRFITPDVTEFLVFRFNGKQPMVGLREKNIFYVIWFDSAFTLYNH